MHEVLNALLVQIVKLRVIVREGERVIVGADIDPV